MIPDEVIEQVRARADVLAVVGESVKLKRAGSSYKGLCPFHGEKTASFVVNPQQGTYHCFGCQAHGDALTFIRETRHLSFPEAVRALAAIVGIEVPETKPQTPQAQARRKEKKALEDRLFEAQDLLTSWYEQGLDRSSIAQAYLVERRITREAAKEFRLGWAYSDVGALVRWMEQAQVTLEELTQIGVVIPPDPEQPHKQGDARLNGGRLRFRNRLMCPIFDLRDRVVGFSGRVIDPQQKIAKYLNSPETPLFKKSEHLYGLKSARVAMARRQFNDLILCEGNLDVIALWQAGFPNAVAAMGTAITEQQSHVIRRMTQSVICIMDGDDAGQKAAFKSLPILLSQNLDVRGKPLPSGQDPDSFIRQFGASSFSEWLRDTQPLLLVYLDALLREYPQDPIGQAAILKLIIPLVRLIESDHQRPIFLDVIAERVGVDRRHLSDLILAQHSSILSRSQARPPQLKAQGTIKPSIDVNPDEIHADEGYEFTERPYVVSDQPSRPYRTSRAVNRHHQGSQDQDKPWWTTVAFDRGTQRLRPRQFGSQPIGSAQIELSPTPQPPPQLAISFQADPTPLKGYEKQAISLLFYHPELLTHFLEGEGDTLFRCEGVSAFLHSLRRERDEGVYLTGERFLQSATNSSLVASLRDCIAHPPHTDERIKPERALADLTVRLKRERLQSLLHEVSSALKSLLTSSMSEEDRTKQRDELTSRFQELQSKLNELNHQRAQAKSS